MMFKVDQTMYRTMYHLLLSCLLLGMLLACAEPVDDINYVQPNYVKKSQFQGHWYHQQTMSDVSPEVSLGFTGYEANLEKIRWEITEDFLYAYRSYEPIPNLDEDDTREGGEYQGDPVAAFRIMSHFDMRRAYNAFTGEESNIITENIVDRVWYDREYMRVDWSSNRVTGSSDLTLAWYFSQASDYIREHEKFDPDHLVIDEDYMQMTVNATVSDGGSTCYFRYAAYDCGSAEIRMRLSFWKIDKNRDIGFKPMLYPDNKALAKLKGSDEPCPYKEYSAEFVAECEPIYTTSNQWGKDDQLITYACTPDFMSTFNDLVGIEDYLRRDNCREERIGYFERFGYFRTERFGYDRQLGGAHDHQRTYYANHHQIWRDEEQTLAQPIIYYTNPGYPRDLEEVTSQIGNEWAEPFMQAVRLKTNKTEDEVVDQLLTDARAQGVKAWMFLAGDQLRAGGMFQVRRNNCSQEGIQDYINRFKEQDTQYQQLTQIIEEATQGDDILPGNILKVCAGLRYISRQYKFKPAFHWQQLGDLRYSFVNWVHNPQPSGPLGYGPSSADPETGKILKGNANVYGAAVDTYARSATDIIRALNEDDHSLDVQSGATYQQWLRASQFLQSQQDHISEMIPQESDQDESMRAFAAEAAYGEYHNAQGKTDLGALRRHLEHRINKPHEHDPIFQASQAPHEGQERLKDLMQDPRFAIRAQDPQLIDLLKPLYGLDAFDQATPDLLEHAAALTMNPKEQAEYEQQRVKFFAEQNMMMADFVDDSIIGLALQLKGQNPEEAYQILRRAVYRAVMLHEIGHTLGLTHNFSASFDAINYPDRFWEIYQQTEDVKLRARARLPEHRYTSIMDYGSRFNSDIHGLGRYDHAAIKFVYSAENYVEVFADDVPSDLDFMVLVNGYQDLPNLLQDDLSKLQKRTHKKLNEVVEDRAKGVLNNSNRLSNDFIEAFHAADQEGLLRNFLTQEEIDELGDAPAWDGYYYLEKTVPYKYCFDFYNGSLDCKTWDEGASHQDVVQGAIQNYWNYYLFNSYRRGRQQYGFINSYFGRQNRLGFYLSYPFRYYYFYSVYDDLYLQLDLYRAAVMSFNFVTQVLGTPEPGKHCLDQARNLYVPAYQVRGQGDCVEPLDIPHGVGRNFFLERNQEYSSQIDYIGSYYDKINMLFYLTDTSSQFFRVSNLGDNRAFSIGYYRLYQEQLIQLVKDLLFTWLEGSGVQQQNMMYTDPQVLVENDENDENDPSTIENPASTQMVHSTFHRGDSFQYLVRPNQDLEARVTIQRTAYNQDQSTIENLPRVQAPISYNMVWQALLLNSVFNTSTYDGEEDFIEYLAVSEVGSGEDRTYNTGQPWAIFTHPYTQVQYKAVQTIDQSSIAFELLARAQAILEDEWKPAKATLESAPNSIEAQQAFHSADQKLGRYSDVISDLRLLRAALDFYNE